MRLALLVAAAVLAAAPAARAQLGVTNPFVGTVPPRYPSPTQPSLVHNPFLTEPWNPITRPELHGQLIGYIEVPAYAVTVEVPAPDQAESAPFRLEPQVVTIPGYWVAETTTGYVYPERWTLEQLNVGVYQWRLRPPEFRHK